MTHNNNVVTSDGIQPYDGAVQRRQAYRLAEISLEELAFVLLTRALHCAGVRSEGGEDEAGGFEGALSSDSDAEGVWTSSCAAAAQALRWGLYQFNPGTHSLKASGLINP